MTSILQKIEEVGFPGTARFVASENFVINPSEDASVKISYLGKNFPVWFLDKVENDISPLTFTYSKLLKSSNDTEIISALEGEGKAEVFLAEMFYLMSLQPSGEEGILLHNGGVNFFYIRDVSGVFRTIRLLWQDSGWGIHAIRPLDPLNLPTWNEGSKIFSRN
ncbi:MAG: hypothetical protein RL292_483 [Candidatus Parcubacteria bacterium]|jgi:hypothetical protein